MRDKHNDACTGPDFYFEKALQHPEFSPSSFSAQNNYRFVLLPSRMKISHDDGHASATTRPTLTRQSWFPTHKDRRPSPVHSPGSNATSMTSLCTDEDYEVEDDIISHCGSLCYSVESWTVEPYSAEEIDDGYHAEDEDTTCNARDVHQSAYNLDHGNDECFGVDLCFQPLDWVNSVVKGVVNTLGAIPQEQENEGRVPSHRRLIDRYDAQGTA